MVTVPRQSAVAPGSRPSRAARVGLLCWAAGVSLVSSYLLGRHALALPSPERPRGAVEALRAADQKGSWMAVHVLYAECGCSQRLVDHFLRTERPAGVSEHVVWVGAADERTAALAKKGFRLTFTTPEELSSRYGVDAAPLLVVSDPAGLVWYSGGYTARKQGPDVRDLEIIRAAREGTAERALPLFGCAVSRALRVAQNPFRRLADQP